MRDTFHKTAITEEGIGIVINNFMAGAIKLARQYLFRQCHSHSVTNALAQRAGSSLYPRGIAVFRMARSLGMQLTEVFNFFNRQIIATEV